MAARGAFQGLDAATTSALLYWKLSGGAEPGEVIDAGNLLARHRKAAGAAAAIEDEAEAAFQAARRLVGDYLLGAKPFRAWPHPSRTTAGNDYDHLSRRAEWAGAEDGDGA